MRTFLDTNILVYLFDNDSPGKQSRSREILDVETAAGRTVLSTQVLQEFFVAVTRKLVRPPTREAAEAALLQFSRLPLVQIDSAMVLGAAQRCRLDTLSFWDALIVESALVGGASLLYTEDMQHGRRFDGLEIRNPFL